MDLLTIKDLQKTYDDHVVFSGFSIQIPEQQITVITGESGCGKTTLGNIIALLDNVDHGDIRYDGKKMSKASNRKKMAFWRTQLGYVDQHYALIEDQTIEHNLLLALRYAKVLGRKRKRERIAQALELVGLSGQEHQIVAQLSGADQQRVALARVYLKPCRLILADEPTGTLDKKNKKLILDIFLALKDFGRTIVILTHDDDLIEIADVHIALTKFEQSN